MGGKSSSTDYTDFTDARPRLAAPGFAGREIAANDSKFE